MISVGDQAPDFTLDGTDGTDAGQRPYSLAEFRGEPVVLVFYPADNSPICTVQLRSYTDDIASFAELGAQVLALSPQSVAAHEAFSEANGGFAFPLLSDAGKEVGRAYGVLGPVGFYRRSVVVIDAAGTVRWVHRATAGLTFRPVEEIVTAIRALEA
ncbi:MAG TPA: peroxiredoxin [Acidimicrobiales bacterium]